MLGREHQAKSTNTIGCMEKSRWAVAAIRNAFKTVPHPGRCPICDKASIFVALGPWLREDLKCLRCKSSARQRALIDCIHRIAPPLNQLHVYEPSPTSPTAEYFERHSARYTWSQYSPDPGGGLPDDPLNQDLQSLGFADESFDLVVTQDVFEHIAEPRRAFAEVARVLKPGGSHVFTVPWYRGQLTEQRARIEAGNVVFLHPPEYHSDPNTRDSALVFTRFGSDIEKLIAKTSGMTTSMIEANAPEKGIRGDSLYIFLSVKPGRQ